ncbi:MAG: hypothetical protein IKR17_07940 [Bacteroidales bacterium]|nr:hypothetical protein [Bacteroidales bacterium]
MNTKICINSNYSDNAALVAFVNNIDEEMNRGGELLFSGRNTVKRFVINGFDEPIVVKRFRKPNALNSLIYGNLRTSKAKRAYENAFELIARGFFTPTPFAYVEQRHCGRMGYCFFLTSECCDDHIGSKLSPPIYDTTIADAFAEFVAQLHTKGVLHYDLNSTNVLYNIDNGKISFSLIDINRMKFFRSGSEMPMRDAFENLTLFTGEKDIFTYVATKYVECRGLPKSFVDKALEQKRRHDRSYTRRKKFSRMFK